MFVGFSTAACAGNIFDCACWGPRIITALPGALPAVAGALPAVAGALPAVAGALPAIAGAFPAVTGALPVLIALPAAPTGAFALAFPTGGGA